MTMLSLSYAAVSASMVIATLYLFLRLRLFITTTTMLTVGLLLVFGPTFLGYTYSSGEPNFLLNLLIGGGAGLPHPIFGMIKSKVVDFDAIIIAMNFSVALMYVTIIFSIEAVDLLLP